MIYLDNGATSFPKPVGMILAMEDCMARYCGNPGRSGHAMSMKTGEEIYKSRKSIGKIFNIDNCSRIIFTLNTTESLNIAIKGILKKGDHAITTTMEHNSVLRPLKALEKEGVSFTIVKCKKDGSLDLENFKRGIRENTKLIICTHASNVTGTIMPIDEIGLIAKEKGITFLVDGAQSAGCIPIDVEKMNIDLLAVPGHKGLLGPLGTGVLYVKDGISLCPLKQGGTGTLSREIYQPEDYPEGFESGTVNAPGIIGLGYSARYVMNKGITNIRNHEEQLIKRLDEGLRNIKGVTLYGPSDYKNKAGISTFNIDDMSCEEVCDDLNRKYGIACRGGFHCAGLAHKTIGTWDCGAVRVSVGPFNTKRDIETLIKSIYQISKK
ncbi:aminotransferase class V-fold PLP-dependent enzyme [Anaerovorax odorimutans]|uniref:aminotransferase class V-fold PLP-dependent enzyme n=1 Tax=Anaerovorax odorimutans TaxID=109327 RepID=UPI0003FC0851|nr:aminotransferase class V-fold PLP-dependent enzyme [Anaerovorax odorimutans]